MAVNTNNVFEITGLEYGMYKAGTSSVPKSAQLASQLRKCIQKLWACFWNSK